MSPKVETTKCKWWNDQKKKVKYLYAKKNTVFLKEKPETEKQKKYKDYVQPSPGETRDCQ